MMEKQVPKQVTLTGAVATVVRHCVDLKDVTTKGRIIWIVMDD